MKRSISNLALEIETRRLLAHLDRISSRRFLEQPVMPTGWPDFEESRTDPVAIVQREARKQKEQP